LIIEKSAETRKSRHAAKKGKKHTKEPRKDRRWKDAKNRPIGLVSAGVQAPKYTIPLTAIKKDLKTMFGKEKKRFRGKRREGETDRGPEQVGGNP